MSAAAQSSLILALLMASIGLALNVAPIIEAAVRWQETRRLAVPQAPINVWPVIAAIVFLFMAVIWL